MSLMDRICVISPDYLSAVEMCIKKYKTFVVDGYPSVKDFLEDVPNIPIYNVIGIAYLSNNITKEDSKAMADLFDLMEHTYIKKKIPFIFLLSSSTGKKRNTASYVKSLVSSTPTSNLTIMFYDFKEVSDVTIKEKLFGTILLTARGIEVSENKINITHNSDNRLHLAYPFSREYIDLFDTLSIKEADRFLNTNYRSFPFLCKLRESFYNKEMPRFEEDEIANANADDLAALYLTESRYANG